MCSGASQHTACRKALMHAQQQGAGTEELLDMALINTAAVLKQKYLDRGRHVTANQRASKRQRVAHT